MAVNSCPSSSLQKIISSLEKTTYNVADQALLIRALCCLRDTVGNASVKDTIANHVNSLIMFRDTHCTNEKGLSEAEIAEMPKLHTVIYGTPGTGKTLLAKILACIWVAVGLFVTPVKSLSSSLNHDVDQMAGCSASFFPRLGVIDWISMFIMMYTAYKVVGYFWDQMSMTESLSLGKTEGAILKTVLVVSFVSAVMAGLYYFTRRHPTSLNKEGRDFNNPNNSQKYISKSNAPGSQLAGYHNSSIDRPPSGDETGKAESVTYEDCTRKYKQNGFFVKYADVLRGDWINIKAPSDFIGKYLGFTGDKTRRVLEESLGKVLFIDEAYGLIPGKHQMYGAEALNELTAFLDAHPGEIVLVMAGYEDKLREGVFEVQKGLDRRFGLHLTCEGYSTDELFQMLKSRLQSQGMKLTNESVCFEEFCKGTYPYMAGDQLNATYARFRSRCVKLRSKG